MIGNPIPWRRSVSARLAGATFLLVATTVALVVGNIYILSQVKGDTAAMNYAGLGRMRAYQLLYLGEQFRDADATGRPQITEEIQDVLARNERRFVGLIDGDPELGVPPAESPRLQASIRDEQQQWRAQIAPLVERLLGATNAAEISAVLPPLDTNMMKYFDGAMSLIEQYQRESEEKIDRFRWMQYAFFGLVTVVMGIVIWVGQNVGRRTRVVANSAARMAGGDLSVVTEVPGSDEVAWLGQTFNTMASNLRAMIETEKQSRAKLEQLLATISDTANSVASASAEILTATSQQAAAAQEQAASVAETVATVDEVVQTSEQAAQRAKAVVDSAQRMVEIGTAGRAAVEESVAAMARVKDQAETIAENILTLAERAQAIGEIIAAVNDVAEQTNLLALNAGIEASRAGEHGTGFTVVAREIKELADQSKKATAEVRQILGEIQKATNRAVMVVEEGTKNVNATIKAISGAGETIRALTDSINEAARTATQISASAGQQATGMAQIHQAMNDINTTTSQNLASTKQTEQAAQDLNALGSRLSSLLERSAA